MKILHALVGYLAVTALPFHPFAFASPLAAIDYDGYVNTTSTQNHIDVALMEQVLGSIQVVETCQTVPTQKHGVHGDIIEARQAELAPPVLIIIGIVALIALSIVWVETDNPVSGNLNDVEFLVEHFD